MSFRLTSALSNQPPCQGCNKIMYASTLKKLAKNLGQKIDLDFNSMKNTKDCFHMFVNTVLVITSTVKVNQIMSVITSKYS